MDNHEKEVLAEIARQYGIEMGTEGTHEEHLDVYNFKKKERKKGKYRNWSRKKSI